ncbi:MAG: glutathione S-transferase [Gammaproteobacteria bacterium]|nr:glutathione S-transferase [Gammaproteobacteria bacterium]
MQSKHLKPKPTVNVCVKNLKLPILYSFRRCPYAIRARLAIKVSNIQVEIREVLLKDKPEEMLSISPKGTVPVLELPDGSVIEESRDIMSWALTQHDPENWSLPDNVKQEKAERLIDFNDSEFKQALDHYKYSDRYPEQAMENYRQQGEDFLQQLEGKLTKNDYLMGKHVSYTDMAIFPFIRQFAYVDKGWFDQTRYINLQKWLEKLLDTTLFHNVMKKYPCWKNGDETQIFD